MNNDIDKNEYFFYSLVNRLLYKVSSKTFKSVAYEFNNFLTDSVLHSKETSHNSQDGFRLIFTFSYHFK